VQQARVEVDAGLHQVSSLRKRQALVPSALEVSPHPGEWLQSLCRSGLSAGYAEMIKLVMALVKIVIGKTADIVKHQFGIIGQGQATSGGVTEKLVAEAAEDSGDDFDLHSLSFFCADDVIQ